MHVLTFQDRLTATRGRQFAEALKAGNGRMYLARSSLRCLLAGKSCSKRRIGGRVVNKLRQAIDIERRVPDHDDVCAVDRMTGATEEHGAIA